ncbi:hypothetical protein AVEN_91625-1, partial [Araneus ventricosus]
MRPWGGGFDALTKVKIAIPLPESSLESGERDRRSSPRGLECPKVMDLRFT